MLRIELHILLSRYHEYVNIHCTCLVNLIFSISTKKNPEFKHTKSQQERKKLLLFFHKHHIKWDIRNVTGKKAACSIGTLFKYSITMALRMAKKPLIILWDPLVETMYWRSKDAKHVTRYLVIHFEISTASVSSHGMLLFPVSDSF